MAESSRELEEKSSYTVTGSQILRERAAKPMTYQFYTADVFTDRPFSGNQLAVFPEAKGLEEVMMQKIAAEFNFSETAFVFPPSNPEAVKKLRIFTPSGEIPFAGHPTIGTALILAKIGSIALTKASHSFQFEEGAGNVLVTVRKREGLPMYAELIPPAAPEFHRDVPPLGDLARVLSLEPGDLELENTSLRGLKPQAVSCGLPFLLIPLRNLEALQRAKIDLSAWGQILREFWAPHAYPFCPAGGGRWRVRMFAPALGIGEDPATGSAAGAFAAYLALHQQAASGSWQWTVEQGEEIGRPSTISAAAEKDNGTIAQVRVGGSAAIVTSGQLYGSGI